MAKAVAPLEVLNAAREAEIPERTIRDVKTNRKVTILNGWSVDFSNTYNPISTAESVFGKSN